MFGKDLTIVMIIKEIIFGTHYFPTRIIIVLFIRSITLKERNLSIPQNSCYFLLRFGLCGCIESVCICVGVGVREGRGRSGGVRGVWVWVWG